MGAIEKKSTRSSNSYHEQLIQLFFSQDFLCYEQYIHKFLLLHWLHLLKSKHFFLQKFLLQISCEIRSIYSAPGYCWFSGAPSAVHVKVTFVPCNTVLVLGDLVMETVESLQ